MIKRLADNEWISTRWKTFEQIEDIFSRIKRCRLMGIEYLIVITHDEWEESINIYRKW
jgi:hypothetical protein